MPRLKATLAGADRLGNASWVPLVPITLSTATLGLRAAAILDSGADTTIVPFEQVAPFGFEWKKLALAPQAKGAGGIFERRVCPVAIAFETWRICDEVEVAEPGKLPATLLGRIEFFSKFVVRFNWFQDPPTFDIDPVLPVKRGWSRKGG